MTKTSSKTFLILLVTFIGISAVRIIFSQNAKVDIIVAFINVVSFLYVFYLIIEEAEEELKLLLKEITYLGERIKEKKQRILKKIGGVVCILLCIMGVVYALRFSTSTINDIVGFLALFCSIEAKCISKGISVFFVKMK